MIYLTEMIDVYVQIIYPFVNLNAGITSYNIKGMFRRVMNKVNIHASEWTIDLVTRNTFPNDDMNFSNLSVNTPMAIEISLK